MVESTGTNVQLVSKDVPAHVVKGTGLGNEEVNKEHLQTLLDPNLLVRL